MNRRGRVLARVLALACAVAAVALVLVARPAPERVSASTPSPAAALPAFSIRRVPALFTDAIGRAQLVRDLQVAVAPYDACVSADDEAGPIARLNAQTAYAPASTLKLITAQNALNTFKPDHRFTTSVVRDAGGNLTVNSGTDPLLATPAFIAHQHTLPQYRDAAYTDITKLADAIVGAGVRNVPELRVNDADFGGPRFNAAWKQSYLVDGEVGALDTLTIDGGFSDPVRRTPSADPALQTGNALATMLRARGVTVGAVRRDNSDDHGDKEIANVQSAPLREIVAEMLRASDNYTAEMLTLANATTASNGRLTIADGLAAFANTDEHVADGSGLATSDRVRCDSLLAVLENTTKNAVLQPIDAGLPVAGASGTLVVRFLGDPLQGRLRAKTGSIDGVVGLAGFIDGPNQIRFAFLARGNFTTAQGQALQAGVAHALAAYPHATPLSGLAPAA